MDGPNYYRSAVHARSVRDLQSRTFVLTIIQYVAQAYAIIGLKREGWATISEFTSLVEGMRLGSQFKE